MFCGILEHLRCSNMPFYMSGLRPMLRKLRHRCAKFLAEIVDKALSQTTRLPVVRVFGLPGIARAQEIIRHTVDMQRDVQPKDRVGIRFDVL